MRSLCTPPLFIVWPLYSNPRQKGGLVPPCGVFTPPLLWYGPCVCKSSSKLADWLLLPFWFTPMYVAKRGGRGGWVSSPTRSFAPVCKNPYPPFGVALCVRILAKRAGWWLHLPPPSQSAGPASATPLRPREPGDTPPSPPPPNQPVTNSASYQQQVNSRQLLSTIDEGRAMEHYVNGK